MLSGIVYAHETTIIKEHNKRVSVSLELVINSSASEKKYHREASYSSRNSFVGSACDFIYSRDILAQ